MSFDSAIRWLSSCHKRFGESRDNGFRSPWPLLRINPEESLADEGTATVQKIITEILPSTSGANFARDARDLLIECCVEFITLISSEANEIAEKEAKKTIASEHVATALKDLGFEEYVQEVMDVANEHKEQLKVYEITLRVH